MTKPNETLSRDDDRASRPSQDRTAQLYILLACDQPMTGSSCHVLSGLERVEIGRADRRGVARSGELLSLGIADSRMSVPHANLVLRDGRWIARDMGSKNGLVVDGERRSQLTLSDGVLFELGHTLLLYRESPGTPGTAGDRDGSGLPDYGVGLRTFLPSFAKSLANLADVARTPAAVLIQGETGTGKELLARAIHQMAQRTGNFVAVNCGALPEAIVESELYGYRKGAFSGAEQDRPGLVRSADHGTLFLDEIADLPLSSQAALLRVLQEREVTPVGATQPVPVDLRVVAATHQDLTKRVAAGEFRRDLYARLSAFTIVVPPLRERSEDFGLLVAALLPRVVADKPEIRLSCAAARALIEHDWPLNVRELESCLTIAGALAHEGVIKLEHLPEPIRGGEPPDEAMTDVARIKREELVALLRQHGGNVSAVARATGKARAQIHRWLRRFNLDPGSYR